MSQRERTGIRDLTYSRWHRNDRTALQRFLNPRDAHACAVIDIDWCEYCVFCSLPIALIETQQSKTDPKPAKVTQALAAMAGIECYSVSYWCEGDDIAGFKVRCLLPIVSNEVTELAPAEYASWLRALRLGHECASARREVSA